MNGSIGCLCIFTNPFFSFCEIYVQQRIVDTSSHGLVVQTNKIRLLKKLGYYISYRHPSDGKKNNLYGVIFLMR